MVPIEVLKGIAEIVEKAASTAALVVGCGWAYYKFVRGRVFRHRLEINISGRHIAGDPSALVTVELKNIGASDIPIRQEGTAATIEVLDFAQPESSGEIFSYENPNTITITVLKHHEWIEPGETIREQCLVRLDSGEKAVFRLALRIVAQGKRYSRRSAWVCASIFYSSEETRQVQVERATVSVALAERTP